MATLRFSFGTMGSGKSTLALQIHHNLAVRDRQGLLLTKLDRDGTQVTSRLGVSAPAVEVSPDIDLFDSTIICNPTNSVNNISKNPSLFTVYPNPATTELTIELTTQEIENASMFLLDLSGKIVRNQTTTVSGTSTSTMDISSLSAGVYVLKITTANGSITKKVVKK